MRAVLFLSGADCQVVRSMSLSMIYFFLFKTHHDDLNGRKNRASVFVTAFERQSIEAVIFIDFARGEFEMQHFLRASPAYALMIC